MSSQDRPSPLPSTRPKLSRSTSSPNTPKLSTTDSTSLPPPDRIPVLHNMPLTKKRSSGFGLRNPPTPSTPSFPSPPLSSRPARNPARVAPINLDGISSVSQTSLSRPSTASSAREEVTPWEFQSNSMALAPNGSGNDKFDGAPAPILRSKSSSIDSRSPSLKSSERPSLRSRASSTAVGPVEEVTPWELYPPIPEAGTKYHIPAQAAPTQTAPFSEPPPITGTGFVEDVVPWELAPPPQERQLFSPPRTPPQPKSAETSTLMSFEMVSRHSQAIPLSPPSTQQHPPVPAATSPQDPHQTKVQKTGPTKDVTPWELEPGPTFPLKQEGGMESQMSMGQTRLSIAQVEEITPWELHPVPSAPPLEVTTGGTYGPWVNEERSIKKKSSRLTSIQNRPSSSGSATKALSDLNLVRPLKSTGKSSKGRQASATPAKSPHTALVSNVSVQHPTMQVHDSQSDSEGDTPQQPSFSTSQHPQTGPATTGPSKFDSTSKLQYKFSTADRVILRELRFVKDAHDAEFIIKGKGHPQQGGGTTPGKIHHAYRDDLAPYPRCYDSRTQDLDIWETLLCHQMCESWTWHVFPEGPPTKVLDIGCGTGTWISSVAMIWPNCHFWGIDLVPTQPDFPKLGDRDLASRIKWVQANFLEGLPFENEQFDFVHIKRVALGVPENKWDALFEECARVLKPGGAFEMIEEDLFFPGKPVDSNEHDDIAEMEDETEPSSERTSISNDTSGPGSPSSETVDGFSPLGLEGGPRFTMSPTTTSATSITPPALASEAVRHVAFARGEQGHDRTSQPPPPPSPRSTGGFPGSFDRQSLFQSHSRSAVRPSLSVKTTSGSSSFANSMASLLGSAGHNNNSSSTLNNKLGDHPNGFGRSSVSTLPSARGVSPQATQHSPDAIPSATRGRISRSESFLSRSIHVPRNPRDHTILEDIYSEMLASRFINKTPLSLLPNYLEYHFVDVRTHPLLLYSFPPTALLHSESRYVTDSESESETSEEASSDDEEARDAIRPKPPKPKGRSPLSSLPRSRYRCMPGQRDRYTTESNTAFSMSDLLNHQSPYITLDLSRSYAPSPATKPDVELAGAGKGRRSRLPNTTLKVDPRSLNMHLYLRAMEVLGCSEPMWEWVMQYQERYRRRGSLVLNENGASTNTLSATPARIRHAKSHTSLNSMASGEATDSNMNSITMMTRDEFEILLSNFELDMQDQASVDYALQERMDWRVFSSPRDIRRKAFDEACRKWDKWLMKQESKAKFFAQRQHHHSRNGQDGHINSPRNKMNGVSPLGPHDLSHGQSSEDSPTTQTEHKGSAYLGSNGNLQRRSSSRRGLALQLALQLGLVPFTSSSLPPNKRLSRAMSVFVAWKPRDPNSSNQAVFSVGGP